MIAASFASANELDRRRQPCMYRVHDKPDPVRLAALAEVRAGLGLRIDASQVVRPRNLTQLLVKVEGRPEAPLVHDPILRAQNPDYHNTDNLRKHGPASPHYAHLTSPIWRYESPVLHTTPSHAPKDT